MMIMRINILETKMAVKIHSMGITHDHGTNRNQEKYLNILFKIPCLMVSFFFFFFFFFLSRRALLVNNSVLLLLGFNQLDFTLRFYILP